MNLILCGMMGVGKTTVGQSLSTLSQRKFVDTDGLIEEKYGKIADIFAEHGEAYFRALETQTVKTLSEEDNLVLSVGGGLVLQAENTALLKKRGEIVYLRAKKETLVRRLQQDRTRPLLQGVDLETRIEELTRARAHAYERAADYVVEVDGKSPAQIAEEILRLTNKR